MFSDRFKTDRTDDEVRWIKERIQVFKKEPPIGQLSRLIEYMYVANIDERWSDCEKLFLRILTHPSVEYLLHED
jgi:hypothetical protein